MIDLRLKYGTNNIPILSNEKGDCIAVSFILFFSCFA